MPELCFATNLTSAEWAAWVGAIGTVLGVFAGAIGIWWQGWKQRRDARQEEIRRLLIIGNGVIACQIAAVQAEKNADMATDPAYDLESVRKPVAQLAAIPALDIPDFSVAARVAGVELEVSVLIKNLAEYKNEPNADRQARYMQQLDKTLRAMGHNADSIKTALITRSFSFERFEMEVEMRDRLENDYGRTPQRSAR